MCGRLSLFAPPSVLEAHFDVEVSASYTPRYNVAPTEELAVIRDDAPETLDSLTWGLVPHWADDPSIGTRLINARAETLAEKPSFRDAYEHRRCLVLADGFYEWRKDGGRKQPYRICRPDDEPFAMAGLWERWEGHEGRERPQGASGPRNERAGSERSERPASNGEVRETATIVTTEPNDVVRPLHDRMAAILPPGEERRWLDADEAERQELLSPYDGDLRSYPISTRVNDPKNDGPAIIEEVEPEGGTQSGLGDFE